MNAYAGLLRAINVGGTGKLPMRDPVALCHVAGFADVRTYIASGSVVFTTSLDRNAAKAALAARLLAHAGTPVGLHLRDAEELDTVLAENPFKLMRPDRTVAIFLDAPPPSDSLHRLSGRQDEEVALGRREIYVHYGEGMGRSRLRIPAAQAGTARNINTVKKLAAMVAEASRRGIS